MGNVSIEQNTIKSCKGDNPERHVVFECSRVLTGTATEWRVTAIKTGILLANTGLSYREISDMTGKSEPAIAKAVSRERLSNKKAKTNE